MPSVASGSVAWHGAARRDEACVVVTGTICTLISGLMFSQLEFQRRIDVLNDYMIINHLPKEYVCPPTPHRCTSRRHRRFARRNAATEPAFVAV